MNLQFCIEDKRKRKGQICKVCANRTTSAPWPREMLKRRRTQWKFSVVEGGLEGYVLHRVLYPQVHVNGVKKKGLCEKSYEYLLREHWNTI